MRFRMHFGKSEYLDTQPSVWEPIAIQRVNFHLLSSTLLVLIFALAIGGCASTNIVKSDYSPRLSNRAMVTEDKVKSVGSSETVYLLRFRDRRCEAKVDDSDLYRDPQLVWKGKGLHEYRLQNKTLADYLFDSLVFDFRRVGIQVTPAEEKSPAFPGTFDQVASGGPKCRFILGIEVLQCRPDSAMGWATVTPSYNYEFNLKMWDTTASKMIIDERIDKKVEGLATPMITFGDLVEKLLNDSITEVNLDIADLVAKAIADAR